MEHAAVDTTLPRPWPRRLLRALGATACVVLITLAVLWGALALCFDGPGAFAAGLFVPLSAWLWLGRWRRRARRYAWFVLFAGLLLWWTSLAPRNDRAWQADVAQLPGVRVEGERITFSAVRNFDWRSDEDGTERWEERGYALADVRGVDLVLSDWDVPLIVHTILSFEFADGRHLAVSIETRKEEGEGYSALRGFFRQYELYYVVADERDVLGVRAAFRGEHLHLYRLRVAADAARELLLVYARRIEALASTPAWYNALSASCTSSIRQCVQELGRAGPFDWRLLANGRVDELLFENGHLDGAPPFAELRARCDVTAAALEAFAGPEAEFSARLRRELPPRVAR